MVFLSKVGFLDQKERSRRYSSGVQKERIRLFIPTFDVESCLSEIRECLEIGWTGAGFKTDKFEQAWSGLTKLENSIYLNSSSMGLLLSLIALKKKYEWDEKSEVITSPLTFVSANHSIVQAGLTPVFCDIDESLNMTLESIRKMLTPKTRAVMFVGIGGNPANYIEIQKYCTENGIKLILDAAHMAGTKNEMGFIGRDSDIAIYSFQAVKNLPTGDSGVVNTSDLELAEEIKKLSWLGISTSTYERNRNPAGYKWEYNVEDFGFKANGNSIMASVALAQLPLLERDNQIRRTWADLYRRKLSSIKNVIFVEHDESVYRSARHLIQVRIGSNKRSQLIDFLSANGVDTGVHYRLNTRYSIYDGFRQDIEMAKKIEEEILSLPNHLRLSEENVIYICDLIRDFFNSEVEV
jgi:dTDP-4-amino-4,6-dideoxygalactose transaminase